jgi:hypothetical protein
MKTWPYKTGGIFLGKNLIVFHTISASEITPDKRGGHRRIDLWREWPDEGGWAWWKWPYKRTWPIVYHPLII